MTELPNVNDGQWLNDRVRREDVSLITNAVGAADEAHRRDLSPGMARIWNGLFAAQGFGADTVIIGIGAGQDVNGKRVYLGNDADEVALLNTGGEPNYIAVKHKYTYSYYEDAFYTGVKYYRTRRDDYEVVVSTSPQDEAGGHVRVVMAYKSGEGLCFDYSYRSYDEMLFAREYVLNLAEFEFDETLTEIPGQWRPAGFTWQYKTIRVCLADNYTVLGYDALPIDLNVCVDINALNTTYTLGIIKNKSGTTDLTVGVRVASAAPNKLLMVVVNPIPDEAMVKGKIELLGIPGAGAAEG